MSWLIDLIPDNTKTNFPKSVLIDEHIMK